MKTYFQPCVKKLFYFPESDYFIFNDTSNNLYYSFSEWTDNHETIKEIRPKKKTFIEGFSLF